MPRYAKNKQMLAKALNISYQSLLKYFSHPEHPENHSNGLARYDIEKWRVFLKSKVSAHNNKLNGSNGANGYKLNEREQSIVDKNRVEAETRRFNLNVKMREYLPRAEVNRAISTANAIVKKELYKAFEEEMPPKLDGLSPIEMRKLNRKKLDQIFWSLPKQFPNAEGKA